MSALILKSAYGLPAIQAETLADITEDIDRRARQSGENYVAIGHRLADAKNLLKHGEFLNWLQDHTGFSERTARNMMAVAEQFKTANVADMKPAALIELAKGNVPEPARREAVARVAAGEKVTAAVAREIVQKHSPPPAKPHEPPAPKTANVADLAPAIVETTARDVTPPPSEPTATDILTALSPLSPRVRKVREDLAGNPFDAETAGRHVVCLVNLLEGEPPAYRLVSEREAAKPTARGLSAADVEMPPALDTPECRKALDEWIEHKRLKRAAYKTPAQVGKLVAKFAGMGAAEFIKAVDHSIANNYQGLFPESANGSGRSGKTPRQPGAGERFDPNHVGTF